MTHASNPFGQVLVALVTPMTADGEVDWPAVEKHIDDVITAGADEIGRASCRERVYACV